MMPSAEPVESTPDQGHPAQMNPVILRVLAGLTVIVITATRAGGHLLDPLFLVITLVVLSYTAATFAATYRPPGETPNPLLTRFFSLTDAALIGAFLTFIQFSLAPFAILATMVTVSALASGGLRSLLEQLAAFSAAALLVASLREPFTPALIDASVGTLVLLTAPVYFCLLAYYLYRHNKSLQQRLEQTRQEMVELKLSNYKLSKYLSPSLRKAILSGKKVKLETHRKKITVFFSDIKGFSELSEELEADSLTRLLNSYLTEMSDIAIKFGGTVDKFIGDALMVFFGDPVSRGVKADCVACVSMAIAMQKRMKELHQRWHNQGIHSPLQVRMGINTGFCTVGNFGTENRLDYTLLGTEVNLASRLESAAAPGEILVTSDVYELVKDTIMCREQEPIRVKGFQEPIRVFSVVDLRRNLGKEHSYVEHVTQGFNMYLDTDKVRNYDRDKIASALEQAYKQLRGKKEPGGAKSTEPKH